MPGDQRVSPAHTSQAMIALLLANRQSDGHAGIAGEDTGSIREGLLALDWEPWNEEVVFRSTLSGRQEEDVLTIWHYSKAWAVTALLQAGQEPTHEKIRKAVDEIYQEQAGDNSGLWNLCRADGGIEKELPIWATLDGLIALRAYEKSISRTA